MAAKTETIICKFIGEFKVGDNLVRNAESLCRLVSSNENEVFNKLIVIQAGSIVEAGLDQIIHRAHRFNKEGVPNISEKGRLEIASTTVEKFNNIIQAMKKYKMLDGLGDTIYDERTSSENIETRFTFRMTWISRTSLEMRIERSLRKLSAGRSNSILVCLSI
jgi:hypothetical protein